MPYKIDEVSGHFGLLHTIIAFAAGWPERGTITESKTGNESCKYILPVSASTPLETWTIECTTAGGDGVAVFSVTGSTSGAQADATAGTRYDNGIVTFMITGPALYDCDIGDKFEFTFATGPMSTGAIAWVVDRYVNQYTNTAEAILHGIGSGSDEIYVGLKPAERVGSDVYNLKLNGFTAFSSPDLWEEQPGAIPEYGFGGVSATGNYPPGIAFQSEPTEGRLYLSCNSRRIQGCVFFESYSAPFYLGLMLPYMTPGQWDYPLFIGGSCGGDTSGGGSNPQRYSNGDMTNTSFFFPLAPSDSKTAVDAYSSARVLNGDLVWEGFFCGNSRTFNDSYVGGQGGNYYAYVFPYALRMMEDLQANIDGSFPLFPIHFFSNNSGGADCNGSFIHGTLDGCHAITGNTNNQENTFTIGSDLYVVVRNSGYSEIWDYMAMRLDS